MAIKCLAVTAGLVLLIGCTPEPPPAASPSAPPAAAPSPPPPIAVAQLPALIVAERGGFIPEGIEYDTNGERLLVGSIAEGSIYEIHGDGRLTPVVQDPALRSSIGIEVDEPRNRLLAANSDPAVFQGGAPGRAMLGVYDLTSGVAIAMVDLTTAIVEPPPDAVYFANDVAVDDQGIIYVTDTRSNVIYRVDGGYSASVLHQFPPAEQIMLNGLVYHPSGYLLVAAMGTGNLYKVPLTDPAATTTVSLPEPMLGADGLVWQSADRLAIVSNSQNRVVLLASSDGWASAQIAGSASFEGQATTAAVADGEIYIVRPHFEDQDPPTVERVALR